MTSCHRVTDRGYCKFGCTRSRRVCHFYAKGFCNRGSECGLVHELERQQINPPVDQYDKDLALFGLRNTPEVNTAMIKHMFKYQALMKHPDKAPPEKKEDAKRKMQKLNNANERLMKRARRDGGPPGSASTD